MNKEKHNIGNWKFGDEINETFIDRDMYDNEGWETPPTLNFESTVTLYYPDGKVITNPTSEEVLEWATIVDATIPPLDTSNVTNMKEMFEGCTKYHRLM